MNQLMNHLPTYTVSSLIKRFLIILIKSYQYMISGFLAPSCRFTPSCSDYTIEAFQNHGVISGCWFALKRLSKCHPFYNKTGYDPIP